jgi:hypothetical protein
MLMNHIDPEAVVVGMAVTIGVHFPINTVIDFWPPTVPPENWGHVRRHWLIAHSARSVVALAAFGLLVAATTRREHQGNCAATGSWRTADAPTPLDSLGD